MYPKSDFTVDEGKERLDPSRNKKIRQACTAEESVTFLLCDPGWCVHKSDVQIK